MSRYVLAPRDPSDDFGHRRRGAMTFDGGRGALDRRTLPSRGVRSRWLRCMVMNHARRLLVGLIALSACRNTTADTAAPPPAPPPLRAAPNAPPAAPLPANAAMTDAGGGDVSVRAPTDAPSPIDASTACVFVGSTARCTRCIERSCRAALSACCGSAQCRAALPALGRCLTATPDNESALTGCWDQFNLEGGTSAEPTLRECMERGRCGICEVPR